ncbi:methyl-accepting chemotaxis protein [Vibrio sinus]|uniref:methyl-accepting chemotaxis protein n=1 Tax=Vibrio sinus TaxID=2946865 RepID=UPI002542C2A8|nr:methyl-accepting chemotaxis protein [Vibrio sinus]
MGLSLFGLLGGRSKSLHGESASPVLSEHKISFSEPSQESMEHKAILAAVNKVQAVIEFNMDGTIITANDNFCHAMGYSLEEIKGKHHSMFAEPDYARSPEYQQFWQRLNAGEFFTGEFRRVGKGGKDVWIHASYNPILDRSGKPYKVVKFASDITQQKLQNADYQGQIEAVGKSQAVIEFNMDGTIITANDNFCHAMGYQLSEIQGQHHRMFAEPSLASSPEYAQFWQRLNQGEFFSGEFKRVGKHGKEIWIQASYNPIFDLNGKPFKVVKYASDITKKKLADANYRGQIKAVGKSQAVIEFNMDGTIITANENFCNAMGYSLEEIQGKHHKMFAESSLASSPEYKQFWQKLNEGEFISGEFKRVGKHGKEVWIQATYNPILDMSGKPFKVVKYASDITAQKIKQADYQGQIEAVGKAQAVIEFNMDGTIITANDNFCHAMGYALDEIQGQHHRMFASPELASSVEYQLFWQKLNRGEFISGEFQRVGKHGKDVWIQATYNPIMDLNGKPFKVVKYASDITAQKMKNADYQGQIEAVGKAQAVIEFNMDGTIITANDNFCQTMGYGLDEIQGQHHRMFAESSLASSPEYQQFWQKLGRGEFIAGEFKRVGKGGKEIWIQATYNPIFDINGKPFKVVKFATDITEQKIKNADFQGQIEAVGKAQAVIEFEMNGTIITANDNFCRTMGYELSEIQGQHHKMFAEKSLANSPEYEQFWQQLNRGEFIAGEFKRVGKGGKEIWIQATYNPILDVNGHPFKVVKFATEVTGRVRAVEEVKQSLLKLEKGNLNSEIRVDLDEQFLSLKDAINNMVGELRNVVSSVSRASTDVKMASDEIVRGNNELSERTETQASSLEETAASMEEMTATVRQNADNAREANTMANEAQSKAVRGGEVVEQAINSMQQINESSKKINDIIGVIDEIAFQTNLLALNAAVEAARAGEQGRGFSVVAAEVRNLAQRSASAAKEIKALIKDSVEKIENGSQLVNQSGETLEEIVGSVRQVKQMIGEITESSSQQTLGIEQVTQAVSQMDEMTQQNALLVEKVSTMSQRMAQQAQGMTETLQYFSMDQD